MCAVVGLAVLAAGTVACGSSSNPSPAVATPASSTQMFTGTVQVGGNSVVQFTVAVSGEVDVTLTAAGPPAGIIMGLLIGNPASAGSSTCLALSGGSVNTPAGSVAQLLGTAPPGAYCVQVYDVGNQTGPVTYSLTITHP
jgi:hypothetical protein